jgi:exopolysaccharide biosynthesis polyprenyl glycosylphosphotransferase
MGRALAVVETVVLFTAASALSFLWGGATVIDWVDIAVVLGRAVVISVCSVVAFYYNDLYDLRVTKNIGALATRALQSFGVAIMLLGVSYVIFPDMRLAEGPLVSSLLVVGLLMLPIRALSYTAMRSRRFVERVLVVGTGDLARQLAEEFGAQRHLGYEVVGALEDQSNTTPMPCAVLGSLEQMIDIVQATGAERIVVALAERRGRLPVTALLQCQAREILVEDGVDAYERLTGKVPIETLTPSRLLFSDAMRRSLRYGRMVHAVTRASALAALIVSAPLFLLIALAIKLDSKGPVLFVQDRVGLYGRPFRLFKFRTMMPSEHPVSHWVRDNYARITRVGQWLRKFRLDELPQLINIVRGDMSLIGPRPHPMSNFLLFANRIPHYALRSLVRPGVTGWAQVRFGYANDLQEEIEKMRFDLFYIKNLSFALDLRILVDTVKIVLFGRTTATDRPDEQAAYLRQEAVR